MRVFFFGIYDLGTRSLSSLLLAGLTVTGIATKLQDGPHLRRFSDIARRRQIPLFAIGRDSHPDLVESIRALKPDLIVVSGYHRLIPPGILETAPLGGINLHPSLLPKYRGPCPWKWVIVKGETRTGVTVHEMDAGFDSGRILAQVPVDIKPDETGGELFIRLCGAGSRLLERTIAALAGGRATPRPQDPAEATHFRAPTDRDARIDWTAGAAQIRNLVRGFNPRPGAWTLYDGERIDIDSATLVDLNDASPPGTILQVSDEGFVVATGAGVLLAKPRHPGWEVISPGRAFELPTNEAPRLA